MCFSVGLSASKLQKLIRPLSLSLSACAKSPVTNTYATDVATLSEVVNGLAKVREATGNNLSDYFVEKK